MTYSVHIDAEAQQQIADTFRYIRDVENKPMTAKRWLQGLYDAIDSLEEEPRRCAYARENDRFEQELRKLVYKSTRLVFVVEGQDVFVVAAPHAHADDLKEAERLDPGGKGGSAVS